MPEKTEEKKTRRSRFFLYQDGQQVVIGKQSVRYEPDVKKNIFGTITVETFFPVKREVKHSFRLDLYPDVHEACPAENIMDDVDQGCTQLFIEANRSAGVQVRAITHITKDKFSYKNMSILTEDSINIDGNVTDMYVLKGIVTHKVGHLRKGDVIAVGDCQEQINKETGKKTHVWLCRWIPSESKFGWKDKYFRRGWMKMFGGYKARYVDSSSFGLEPGDVRVVSGNPVEETTDRED